MKKNVFYTITVLIFVICLSVAQMYQLNQVSQPPLYVITIVIFLFFLINPYFYVFVAVGVIYDYFAKNINGLKQHLIGGGIAGFLSAVSIRSLVEVKTIVRRTVYDFSPSLNSFNVGQTVVSQNPANLSDMVRVTLISIVVSTLSGAILAAFCYVAWPKIKRNFN